MLLFIAAIIYVARKCQHILSWETKKHYNSRPHRGIKKQNSAHQMSLKVSCLTFRAGFNHLINHFCIEHVYGFENLSTSKLHHHQSPWIFEGTAWANRLEKGAMRTALQPFIKNNYNCLLKFWITLHTVKLLIFALTRNIHPLNIHEKQL